MNDAYAIQLNETLANILVELKRIESVLDQMVSCLESERQQRAKQ
jgi:hypothetical protein